MYTHIYAHTHRINGDFPGKPRLASQLPIW